MKKWLQSAVRGECLEALSESGATIAVQTNRDGSLDLEALVARIESKL